ncbi:c-type cytochrome [Pseudohaliea rubra]|uniref:Putative diheme cytochrome c-553 n=1 Tax=Pseudohaliea rubra DSM 19751 TaxID=1265313 RepID=A0A095VU77_9GAMM|nr:cytochrome c [Pseudohaliea rubra]KGE05007.1 putative diheme cytochrome c-553 [Pseudohaliea rubra DSM 19751]
MSHCCFRLFLLPVFFLFAAGASATAGDDKPVDRGRYLVTAGNCASCHTAAGGAFMAGGVAFETPFGTLYSTNITPDPTTGIGNWNEDDFRAAMRHGVRPDGEHLYPAFPYTAYTRLTDDDLAAVWAYLREVPPVQSLPPENGLVFPFDQRPLLAAWKLLYLESGPYEPVPTRSAAWNRGAYLVEALGHCSACHSPRNRLGAEQAELRHAGGEYLDRIPGGGFRPWFAPNLTAHPRGLALWRHEDLTAYLATGRNDFLEAFGPMNEVIMNSTRYLNPADIDAMATYLKALPAAGSASVTTEPPGEELLGRGRSLYNLHCGTCHLPSGEGDPEMAPRLNRGSLVVQAENPASLVNVILYGPEIAGADPERQWFKPMEAYRYLLDDAEVAAVATYIRNAWDNAAGTVAPAQVARQR